MEHDVAVAVAVAVGTLCLLLRLLHRVAVGVNDILQCLRMVLLKLLRGGSRMIRIRFERLWLLWLWLLWLLLLLLWLLLLLLWLRTTLLLRQELLKGIGQGLLVGIQGVVLC
jgi:hypothetical protein